jgi:hypothetical protein
MGYELWVMPLGDGADPWETMGRLFASTERVDVSEEIEARRRRLAERLVALEPELAPVPRDRAALAEALPDLTAGQIAHLARTIQLGGWPGVDIRIADDWFEFEIATWQELAEPGPVARLTRLIAAVCEETGWSCVDGERNLVVGPAEGVAFATRRAAEWGRRVADLAGGQDPTARG